MSYNSVREAVGVQHIDALTALTNLYVGRLPAFLSPVQSLSTDDAKGYVTENFFTFLRPFQTTAAQLGLGFYQARRNQATADMSRVPSFNPSLDELDLNNIFDRNSSKLNLLNYIIEQGTQSSGSVNDLTGMFGKVSTNLITEVDRDVIIDLSDLDGLATTTKRIARPDGCNFCKSVALDSEGSGGKEFHDNCHCVIDAQFSDEIAFRQAFYGNFQQDREEAIKLIESGEAGERTIQVGSDEWKAKVNRELSAGARGYRKDFEREQGVRSTAERNALRQQTAEELKTIQDKMSQVAKGNASFTASELETLDNWGFPSGDQDLGRLLAPQRRGLTASNRKDVLTAMDVVQKKRSVMEA